MKNTYIIVGGGLAGASSIEGIREIDKSGTILLIGKDKHLPYHRPPLSKGLWTGKKKVDDIFVHDEQFYTDQGVTVQLGRTIADIDATARTVTDGDGVEYQYEKLLIATGGDPNTLSIQGNDEQGVFYFRTLDDYLALLPFCKEGASALVIGGGFIGTEMAAALLSKKVSVTMLFPESRPCFRVFPESLGLYVAKLFNDRGIRVVPRDKPSSIEKSKRNYRVHSQGGRSFECDFIIAGLGITPSVGLAKRAGLDIENGFRVNSLLQTSRPEIFAAGDNAVFPQAWSKLPGRIEHWDNALGQGRQAGRNMAGAHEPYTYIPYFFSDLFDVGYEAVGEVDSRHETFADWQEENKKGVIYYLKENIVVGVLLCNIWEKVDRARELIKKNVPVAHESLRGAIR